MPDMRDAIAQYLASGRGQQQMPPGGLPGMGGGQQQMPPPPPPAPGGVPANLQGYQQLPSGQFMPPTPQAPPMQAPGVPPPPPPGLLDDFTPPVDTPMQAPGPQVGGMDQNEWYRMYTGGR